MRDLDILESLLITGNHLSKDELKRARKLVRLLQLSIKYRTRK